MAQPLAVRRLRESELGAAYQLRRHAFGGPAEPPSAVLSPSVEVLRWGAFDPDGVLVGVATDLVQGQWFGGRVVPASGIAAVTVAPELRATGVAKELMRRLLEGAHRRGALVASLFPSVPALYRSVGFEHVGDLRVRSVDTGALARLRMPGGVTLRRLGADLRRLDADADSVRGVYRAVAATTPGMVERVGRRWPVHGAGLRDAYDGVTLAVDRTDAVAGYAAWRRTGGETRASAVEVDDLLATSGEATAALLASLGSWSAIAATIRLRLLPDDPVELLLPAGWLREESRLTWMLRLLDAPAAVAARGWPPGNATMDLEVIDPLLPANAGSWRLEIGGGEGRLVRGGAGRTVLGIRGLSALYAGTPPSLLRRAGLLGGDAEQDSALAAVFASPRTGILDDF